MTQGWGRLLLALAWAATCHAATAQSAQAPATGAAPDCASPATLADGWQVAAPAQERLDAARLCEAVRAFMASPRNLHALVVEHRGRLVAEQYRAGADVGWLPFVARQVQFDAGALHDMRSISKSVVSLLWGIAQAEVAMPPLGTPVLDLFPALADLRSGGRERITVEDLLAMRSGLLWDEMGRYGSLANDENALEWRADVPRHVLDRPLAAPPATHFNYNGGHTAVLAQLLEARTGMRLEDYARRKLFEPLGITQWEWKTDLRGRARSYAGLRLRPRDAARIGRMVLDGGRWNGRQVVPAAWLQASFVPRLAAGDLDGGRNYGYQWWLGRVRANGRSFAWRAGVGNGGQRLFMVPELDLVVVLTAGEYNDSGVAPELLRILGKVVDAAVQGAPS